MRCPIDQAQLYEKTFNDAVIHCCGCCEGVFLPGSLFRDVIAQTALLAHRETKIAMADLNKFQRICPAECRVMLTLTVKEIEIEVCPDCKGIWLDHGELEKMVVQYGLPRSQSLEKIDLHLRALNQRDGNSVGKESSKGLSIGHADPFDVVEMVIDLVNFFN